MALSSKALIIVPGACAPAALYDDTVARLIAKGFSPDLVKVVPTPSVGRPAPGSPAKEAPTMYDDANLVRKYAEELADAGHDILLIAHSYGGLPATEGIKGVSKKARAAEGKAGGVSRLFYTTAVVPKVGGTLGDIMGSGGPEFLIIEGDYLYNEVEASASRNYSDLPHDEGVEMAKKLDWHSVVTFSNPVTYPGYNDVPVSYLFCEDDQTVLPEMQQAGIDNIEESSGQKVDIIRLKAGHIPYISQPDKVVDIIAEVAQKS